MRTVVAMVATVCAELSPPCSCDRDALTLTIQVQSPIKLGDITIGVLS